MMMGSAKVAIVDFCCMVLTNCSPWMRAVISLLYRRPAAVLSWAAMDSCPAASSVFPFTGQFLCVQVYFFISVHELEPQGHPHFFRVQLGFLI